MYRYLLILLAITALTAPAAAADDHATTPNFSGRWTLNRKLSDPLQPARPTNGQAAHGGGMSGTSGRRGGGRGGGRRDSGMSPQGKGAQDSGRGKQRAAQLQQELSHLEIFHDGIELDVTNGLDISHLLFTDGRSMTIWTQRGEATATATWEGNSLVVAWKTPPDNTLRRRRYTLAADGRQLKVTVERPQPGSDELHEIVLIYDKTD